VQKGYLFQPNL